MAWVGPRPCILHETPVPLPVGSWDCDTRTDRHNTNRAFPEQNLYMLNEQVRRASALCENIYADTTSIDDDTRLPR